MLFLAWFLSILDRNWTQMYLNLGYSFSTLIDLQNCEIFLDNKWKLLRLFRLFHFSEPYPKSDSLFVL